ncbi:MAG: hypothetical protein ACRDSL_15865 [Pseudonocardiaceae bacterium]
MIRRLGGSLLVVVGILGTGLTGLAVAQAVSGEDVTASVVVIGTCALITLGAVYGAWVLLRRRGERDGPILGWEPGPGHEWLPPEAWADLPDVLPNRPRLGPRPPNPVGAVPPDETLRRLWRVRAELAFDQSGGMYSYSLLGWTAALSGSVGLALLLGAFLANGNPTTQQWAAIGPVVAALVVAVVVSGERASRNHRRHIRLRRRQHELAAAYEASSGGLPAGPAVRLSDPASLYDPGRPPEADGSDRRAGEPRRQP